MNYILMTDLEMSYESDIRNKIDGKHGNKHNS